MARITMARNAAEPPNMIQWTESGRAWEAAIRAGMG